MDYNSIKRSDCIARICAEPCLHTFMLFKYPSQPVPHGYKQLVCEEDEEQRGCNLSMREETGMIEREQKYGENIKIRKQYCYRSQN